MRDLSDNCYAEAKDLSQWPLRTVKVYSVKVQTNVLELLGIDDLDGHDS